MTCGPIWLLSLASCALGHIMPVQKGREAGRASGGGNREKLAFLARSVLPRGRVTARQGNPARSLSPGYACSCDEWTLGDGCAVLPPVASAPPTPFGQEVGRRTAIPRSGRSDDAGDRRPRHGASMLIAASWMRTHVGRPPAGRSSANTMSLRVATPERCGPQATCRLDVGSGRPAGADRQLGVAVGACQVFGGDHRIAAAQ